MAASSITDDGTNIRFGSYLYYNLTFGQLNGDYATNGLSSLVFNYNGYLGGTTQFRNTDIYDGKNALACTITGSTKTLNCIGGLQVNGTSVATTSNISGTTNTLAMFTGPNTVGDSTITKSGGVYTITGSGALSASGYLGADTIYSYTGGATAVTIGAGGGLAVTNNATLGSASTNSHVLNGQVNQFFDGGATFGATPNLSLWDTTAMAADEGAMLYLAGRTDGVGNYAGPRIKAVKQNGTSGNTGFGLAFATYENGVGTVERMRISDVGVVTTSKDAYIGLDTGTGSKIFNVGRDAALTTDVQNGWRVNTYSDGNIYIDHKTWTGGSINYRSGSGAASGANNAWMVVAPAGPTVSFPGSTVTVSGRLGVGSANPLGDGYTAAVVENQADVDLQIRNTATGGRSFILGSGATASAIPNSFYIYDTTAGQNRLRIDSSGNVSDYGNTTLGDATTDAATINGGALDFDTVGTSINLSDTSFTAYDDTAMAASVGGALLLGGKYTTGGAYSVGAALKAMKTNATTADNSFDLAIGTRASGGNITQRMLIKDAGDVYVSSVNAGGGRALFVQNASSAASTTTSIALLDGVGDLFRIISDNAGSTTTLRAVDRNTVLSFWTGAAGGAEAININGSQTVDVKKNFQDEGNTTLGDATSDSTTINGNIVQSDTDGGTGISTASAPTGYAGTVKSLDVFTGGSVDTTATTRIAYGQVIAISTTRSAGANALENDGLLVSASGAQSNFAIKTNQGNNLFNTGGGYAGFNGQVFAGDTSNTSIADNVDVLTLGNTGTSQNTDVNVIKVTHSGTYDISTANHEVDGIRADVTTLPVGTTSNKALTSVGVSANVTTTASYGVHAFGVYATATAPAGVGCTVNCLSTGGPATVYGIYAAATGDLAFSGYFGTGTFDVEGATLLNGPSISIGSSGSSINFVNGPTGINIYNGKSFEYTSEWLGRTWTTGSLEGPWYTNLSSGVVTSDTGVSGRNGIIELSTSTASTGAVTEASSFGGIDFNADATTTYEQVVRFPTLSTVSEEYAGLVGFYDTNAVDQVDECAFLYDRGGVASTPGTGAEAAADKFNCICAANSVRTQYPMDGTTVSQESFTTVNEAVVANTWYDLKIVLTGTTRAEFYVNGTKACDINTNIPSGSARMLGSGFFIRKSAGTTARTMQTDFTRLAWTLSSARSP